MFNEKLFVLNPVMYSLCFIAVVVAVYYLFEYALKIVHGIMIAKYTQCNCHCNEIDDEENEPEVIVDDDLSGDIEEK